MNIDNIKKIISSGESLTVEFKKSTGLLKSVCETICAFLNCDGGTLLIGVTDDGKIVGQEVTDKTKREIGIELSKISPVVKLEIFYEKLPGTDKYIIAIHVTTDSTKRPYMYNHKAFLRNQSTTIPMPMEHLKHLTLSNADENFSWENLTPDNVTIEDLDTDRIISTIHEGTLNGRIPEGYATTDPLLALKRLDLIVNNKITNAAIVLFGKNPQEQYPQCILKLARFRGIDRSIFIDNKQVSGNVFKLLSAGMTFLNNYLPIESTFPEGQIERVDRPLFPIKALREAVANALCHRDYSNYSGSISIAIYDNRIEVWNYGLFPPGVSVATIKDLNRSMPRNRKIANVLYYHKIFESWGRGINMIMDECKEAGHPEPIYSQDPIGTLLTLISKEPIGNTQIIAKPSITYDNLSKQQQNIITLLGQKGELSSKDIIILIKPAIPERTLRRELTKLKDLGLIDSTGETTSKLWYLLT